MCDELSRSRGQEELAAAAKATCDLEIFLEGCILQEAREDPDLHGLNFNLHPCDLLVPHTESQMAGGHAQRFAGFRKRSFCSFTPRFPRATRNEATSGDQ